MNSYYIKGKLNIKKDYSNFLRENLNNFLKGRYYIKNLDSENTVLILKGYIIMNNKFTLDVYLDHYISKTGDLINGNFLIVPYGEDDIYAKLVSFKGGKKEIKEISI